MGSGLAVEWFLARRNQQLCWHHRVGPSSEHRKGSWWVTCRRTRWEQFQQPLSYCHLHLLLPPFLIRTLVKDIIYLQLKAAEPSTVPRLSPDDSWVSGDRHEDKWLRQWMHVQSDVSSFVGKTRCFSFLIQGRATLVWWPGEEST